MNHSQVAHVWANKGKEKGTGPNLFFRGDSIFSYGSHFEIARHVTNSQGQAAVIFTRRSYSVSTERHKGYVWKALAYGNLVPTFYGDPSAGTSKNALRESVKQYIADAKASAVKAKKARVHGASYAEASQKCLNEAARMNSFFKLGLKVPAIMSEEEVAKLQARDEAARKAQLLREKKALAKRQAEDKADFEAWQNGEGYRPPFSYNKDANGSAYLRIKDDEVQTSQGAQVPLAHAKRVFRFVKACKEQKQAWHANGTQVRIGYFHLTSVDAKGNLHAGCHYITWERVAECAQAGGFFEEAASTEAVEKTAA